ncbi:MAG TPA: cytochrome c oxidase subunit II [Candidatus Limnocylindrales bacterium]|nr:cytochrome c oxidase subunit II [Candidatus Limnocylindrales bacterium]
MRRWGAGAAAASVVLLASGCSAQEALSLNAPEGATEQTPIIESLWFGAWVAVAIVGVLTGGLILYAAIRFRRKDGDPAPKQMRYNVPLELMYTIVPLVMIMGMFFFTARDQIELTKVSANPDNTIGVVGFRWSWAFNYVEDDVYDVGTAEVEDIPTLYLPVNESVVFELQSPDVIHSFWIPAFLMKMDVFPDRMNKFEVTPNKVGTYAGRCAELCGVDHARMLFTVEVVERAEYARRMAELRAKGQVGAIETDRITRDGERYWETDRYPEQEVAQ